jgi:hypothetical protein
MLTVEIYNAKYAKAGRAVVEVYCDAEGLALFSRQIEDLKNGSSHVHLMTPGWAGNELDEKAFGEKTDLVNHLRITMIPPS